ncbi:MAG: hypothetical protein ACE5JB_15710 [bacterium]
MRIVQSQYDKLIFTTGAFLKPIKVVEVSGEEVWMWQVVEFVDDSFKDGNVFNPNEFADSIGNLFIDTTK